MAKQWHNPKIPRRPYARYNPSLEQKISKTYSPWILLSGLLCLLIGAAIIVLAIILKVLDGDISDEIFHLWIGIPLALYGLLAVVPVVLKSKKVLTIYLIFGIIVMVVCATGACVTGVRYWMDHWQQAKFDLDDNKCAVSNDVCVCPSIQSAMPASVDDCDDLELMVRLVISEIALAAGGFLACIMAIFVSFMAICCAPWMYIEWYDESNDPDIGGHAEHVRTTRAGTTNAAYGMH